MSTSLQIDWATYDREHIKEHAYHESGHAVVEFLVGRARGHLVHISMLGDDERAARVRRERCIDVTFLLRLKTVPDDQRALVRAMAIREGIFCLAGPAAEWRATGDPNYHWFDELCKSAEYEENSDFRSCPVVREQGRQDGRRRVSLATTHGAMDRRTVSAAAGVEDR